MIELGALSKTEVNAAIETLIASTEEDDWEAAASKIIAYAMEMQSSSHIQLSFMSPVTNDDTFVAHTAEAGDIEVKDKPRNEETHRTMGINQYRVGHYKMNRVDSKLGGGVVRIQKFWKADLATSADEARPPEYHLRYGADSRLVHFGRMEERIIFSFVLLGARFTLTRRFLAVLLPEETEVKQGIGIKILSA